MASKKELPSIAETQSVFAAHRAKVYPYSYAVTLNVGRLVGGTPSNSRVALGWIKSKFMDTDTAIHSMVSDIMLERGISAEEAIEQADFLKHLNGFKRDEKGLYIEGRQIKSAIKEMANIRWAKERWGPTNKGTSSFMAEHILVLEDKVHLTRDSGFKRADDGSYACDDVMQRFVKTFRGTGIQYEEYCDNVNLTFTLMTDYEFPEQKDFWADLWVTGEQQGVGASRSQGMGRYKVIQFDPVSTTRPRASRSR